MGIAVMGNPAHENVGNNYDPLSLYARAYIRLLSLLFLSLALVFPASAAPSAICIDNPSEGKVLSGIVSFGWAVGETHQIRDIQFFIGRRNKGLAVGASAAAQRGIHTEQTSYHHSVKTKNDQGLRPS